MTRKEIEMLNNTIITAEQMEDIDLCPEVINTECLGTSGQNPSCHWYSVEFTDETSIDVYMYANAYTA